MDKQLGPMCQSKFNDCWSYYAGQICVCSDILGKMGIQIILVFLSKDAD